jgi:hypothetical protein
MFSFDNRTKFEHALDSFLKGHGGVVVAGITRPGTSYTFLAYTASSRIAVEKLPLDEALRSICVATIEHDPDWSTYESWLSDEAMYGMHDKAVMAELERVGDTFSLPRDVDFLWRFPTTDAAVAAMKELAANDLYVELHDQTTVKLVRHMPVALEGLRQLRERVLPIASPHGGALTFWGCHPATFKRPSLLDCLKGLVSSRKQRGE